MKGINLVRIRSSYKSLFLMSIFFGLFSCNEATSDKVEGQVDTLSEHAQNAVAEVKDEYNEYRDESFVKNAAEKNYEELHLLALAMKKATTKDIKKMATKMHADHEKLATLLNAYAAKNNINTNIDGSATDMLDDKAAGVGWDKDWLDKLTNEHEKMIEKFEDANTRTSDNDLKAIISDNLPVLRSHYEDVKEMQDKMSSK